MKNHRIQMKAIEYKSLEDYTIQMKIYTIQKEKIRMLHRLTCHIFPIVTRENT